jgi:hypothetical protein
MVQVGGGTKDKAAVGLGVKLDLAGKEKLLFSAFNGEKTPANVAVAIITAKDYYESRPVIVRPDWNTDLSVELASGKFKCKGTNWRFEAKVEGLDQVRQLLLLLYTGRREALLYFDNVRAE